jgi:hypothetical protein
VVLQRAQAAVQTQPAHTGHAQRLHGKRPRDTSAQVNDLVSSSRVEVYMPTQLIVPRAAAGMKAAHAAPLHMLQSSRCGQAEDSTPAAWVSWRHHDGDALLQHRLVAALCVDVN